MSGVRLDAGSPLAPIGDVNDSGANRGLISKLATAFRDGRGGALWVMGVLVGLIAGYATLGLRLTISAIEVLAFGVTEESLASAAADLPAGRLLLIPVAAGCIIAILLWLGGRAGWVNNGRASGVPDVLEARAVKNGRIELKTGLYSALLAAISLGGGGSAGREGPAVHLGGTLASQVSRLIGLSPRGSRILLACGAAAAVSASFNAPVAGALFAFEVVLGHYALRSIAPVAVSSVIGALIVRFHLGDDAAFAITQAYQSHLFDYPAAAMLGIAAAGMAILFDRGVLHGGGWIDGVAKRLRLPLWLLPIPGGLVIGCLALIAPEILGVGYEATSNALSGEYMFNELIVLIALKTLATFVTIGFRFAGGVFSPSIYLGAMLGAAFGLIMVQLFGDQTAGAGFFAVVGMGAVSGAVLGAPLSTTLIVFELTSSYEAAVAVLVAVSLATVLTQSALGGSLFHKQVMRRGYDISGGASRLVLQMVRVRQCMMPLDNWGEAEIDSGVCLYEDDTLGRAMGVFDAEQLEGAAVRSRSADQPIIGWLTKADAQAAYAKSLAEISEEEHR